MSSRSIVCSALAALFVSACGGGGGDGGSGDLPPDQTFDMNAAIATVLTQGVTYPNLHASFNGVDLYASVSFQPNSAASFRGMVYQRSVETLTMSSSVLPPETFTQTFFYSVDPTRLVGGIDQSGLQAAFILLQDLPTAGMAGQSGPYVHVIAYAEDNQTVVGENWVNWSLEQDAPGTALACLSWAFATSEVYEKDCFQIDPAGHVSGAAMTVYYEAATLEFR